MKRFLLFLFAWPAFAQPFNSTNVLIVDLPAVMQLAGARNLDIQLARQKLFETRANNESALWSFFPSITPGFSYRRHDNLTQDVQGNILDVSKESYALGPTINLQLDIGDAIYKNLAARQLVKAADFGLESQRQDSVLAAASAYFDFARAEALIRVAEESVRISKNYADQLDRAAEAGIAFKGDVLRARVQLEKNRLTLRQAVEQRATATARLLQVLHLDNNSKIVPRDETLAPLNFVATNLVLDSALTLALSSRPEIAQSQHLLQAARQARKGSSLGPAIPSLGAQIFAGGFGGGNDSASRGLGESEDYAVTLGWRIGPGGLFDRGRIKAAEARLQTADLNNQKLIDEINRQVTESFVRWQSLSDQIAMSRVAIEAAEGTLKLTRQRKEFGVGAVLEDINAEQDLTRARLDYVTAVAEYNKAQFTLLKATGGLRENIPNLPRN